MTDAPPRLPAGYRLLLFDSVGSTNDEAKALARGGAAAGTVVWAREQTAGRGRRGRAWSSPRGNFYASLILRPDCPASRAAQLGFVATLAIGGALRELVPSLGGLSYKWPNDVLIDRRKAAGILLEAELVSAEQPSFLVVGIGINLATSPRDAEFPATSLREEGCGAVSLNSMVEGLVRHFDLWERRWCRDGFAPVRAAWLAGCSVSPGEPIWVRLEAASWHGRFLEIDKDGALLLETAEGRRRVTAGEVFPGEAVERSNAACD